jgi:hypothetical protein
MCNKKAINKGRIVDIKLLEEYCNTLNMGVPPKHLKFLPVLHGVIIQKTTLNIIMLINMLIKKGEVMWFSDGLGYITCTKYTST